MYMQKPILPNPNRLFCPISDPHYNLFFSLVDYKNNYFTSNDPNKIIEFYDGFEDRDQLTNWMKERPTGVTNIFEVEGSNEIIVVIPTADFNGKYARECRENIFKGLHIIFVESGEVPDPYFNYAHSCNVGIKKAMEYNAKWIVVSNDDEIYIDSVDILKQELLKLDVNSFDFALCSQGKYHTIPSRITIPRYFRKIIFMILNHRGFYKERLYLENKFLIYKFPETENYFFGKHFFRKVGKEFFNFGTFIAFNAKFLKLVLPFVFDECYINGFEDHDLSYSLFDRGCRFSFINYKIGDVIGGTIGLGPERALRDIANLAYFNEKLG